LSLSFVDTNIWVYAFDQSESNKYSRATELLAQLITDNAVATSSQVLNEAYVVLLRILKEPTPVRKIVEQIADCQVVDTDWPLIISAIDIGIKNQISHWDALLVAAAVKSGCKVLYTEDLQHDQLINGVKVINPFKD